MKLKTEIKASTGWSQVAKYAAELQPGCITDGEKDGWWATKADVRAALNATFGRDSRYGKQESPSTPYNYVYFTSILKIRTTAVGRPVRMYVCLGRGKNGRLRLGCKFFGPKNSAIIKKWAGAH